LDEKEIAFLLNTKPETKKVRKIIEEAAALKQKEISLKRKPLQALREEEIEEEKEEEKIVQEESKKQTKLF
jgi:hypothetical protein